MCKNYNDKSQKHTTTQPVSRGFYVQFQGREITQRILSII